MTIEFKLDKEETKEALEFQKNHTHDDRYLGAIGGKISYILTPTGLGAACTIKCNVCGETKNITNYNSW